MTAHHRGTFNVRAFADVVDQCRQHRGLSAREVNREIGLPEAAGIIQLRRGVVPSAETLVRYMVWIGITDLAPFIHEEPSDV